MGSCRSSGENTGMEFLHIKDVVSFCHAKGWAVLPGVADTVDGVPCVRFRVYNSQAYVGSVWCTEDGEVIKRFWS